MAYVTTKGKFHVALNGVGLILQGSPDRPGYAQDQAPTYGTRFASGDRTYNDLSKWWYFNQTDWSGGIKDSPSWADDAKFYYSQNIDVWSEIGAIKLARKPVLYGSSVNEGINCGIEGDVNGTTAKLIGTDNNYSTNKAAIYQDQLGTLTNIASGQLTTNQTNVSQTMTRLSVMWASIIGTGNNAVLTWTGSAFTDQTGLIGGGAGSPFAAAPLASRCQLTVGSKHYVFIDNILNKWWGLASCTSSNPSAGSDWAKVIEVTNDTGAPIACAEYLGDIYYLVVRGSTLELRVYDISGSTDASVQTFRNASADTWALGDKLLTVLNGKLVITVPTKEIWEYDGATMRRIFRQDDNKTAIGSTAYLSKGAVIADNKAWWGNLMYDGESFFNTFACIGDTSDTVNPLFVDGNGVIWHTDSADNRKLYSYTLTGSTYKGTADKNYIVLSNHDVLSGIDKLAYSFTILFKPLVSGQKIAVEYFTGELTSGSSFTALGNASYTGDGGVITSKTFFFADGTTYKKLWIRIKLEGGGSDTPTLTDVISTYLPIPSPSKQWQLNINCADDLKRLDGRLAETTGREMRSLLEMAWWTKSVVDYQDLDYASTAINNGAGLTNSATSVIVDDTTDFPEQGRIRIGDEEIFYTGKTPTTFTGLTRGARDTRAVAHSNNDVVHNAYKVVVKNLQTRVPLVLKDKYLEYIVGVLLEEA